MEIAASGRRPTFIELHGLLDTSRDRAISGGDTVMLTNIRKVSGTSRRLNGLTLRYVARGEELYRIGGRAFRLTEGQLMLARQEEGAEIEIRAHEPKGTLGLCTFLNAQDERDLGELAGPIVIDGSCSPIGWIMKNGLAALSAPAAAAKAERAAGIVSDLLCHVPSLLTALADQAEAVRAGKASTKFEAVRKVNIARSYLHSVTNRIVSLEELGVATGASRFHLQRSFRQCLGETPALYHRRLRLTLALDAAKRRGLPLDMVADEFGFAGASSFSHAFRRTFGRSPVWNKRSQQ